MPTLEVSKRDLEKLVGKTFWLEGLEEALMYVKGEIDGSDGDKLSIDVKETNRPELWSTEGIAREIRARIGREKGIRKYRVGKARTSCTIDKSVEKSRPFICCAVIRGVKVTENLLVQMIQLQEKVSTTFGRKRRETGIGLYDFDKMTPPIYYKGLGNNEIEFAPLEYRVKMRPSEILAEHPKGKEFGHLLQGTERFPIVIDSRNVVASMPPIINSEETGKVTEKTRNLFLEVTGWNWETVNTALKVMVMALADRGGKIEAVKINFPKTKSYPSKSIETPQFGTKKISFALEYANKVSGISFKPNEIVLLAGRSGMNAKVKGKKVEVEYPDYRQDILHPIDIVEDIIISYGYNRIEPEPIRMPVIGEERPETIWMDLIRDVCVGLGLQEVLTFTMSSKEKQEQKTGLVGERFVEIANPVSSNWEAFRKTIFPELLEFLSKNKHVSFPHKIFEVGKTLELNPQFETGVEEKIKLCIVLSDPRADFSSAKSVLEAVCRNMNWNYSLKEAEHPALVKGKTGEISVGGRKGIIGELSQKTLKGFGVEEKTCVIELEI